MPDVSPAELEATTIPRAQLRLRWLPAPADVRQVFGEDAWLCHYELAISLTERDTRGLDRFNNRLRDEIVHQLSEPQVRIARDGVLPCEGKGGPGTYWCDVPMQLTAHAVNDSRAMGGITIVVIAPDGTVIKMDGL